MNQLNEAQKILQEKLEFGLLNSLLRNQRASTSLRRTELTKDSVITKLGIYDTPNKFQEIEDKTCIVYDTALTRDYLRDELNMYKEWKVFKYEEFAAITNSVIEVFINGRKIWFKDIEVRVRKDVVYLLIPKIEISEIQSITIFELPEKAFKVSYNSGSDLVNFPKKWKDEKDSKFPVAYSDTGIYNRVANINVNYNGVIQTGIKSIDTGAILYRPALYIDGVRIHSNSMNVKGSVITLKEPYNKKYNSNWFIEDKGDSEYDNLTDYNGTIIAGRTIIDVGTQLYKPELYIDGIRMDKDSFTFKGSVITLTEPYNKKYKAEWFVEDRGYSPNDTSEDFTGVLPAGETVINVGTKLYSPSVFLDGVRVDSNGFTYADSYITLKEPYTKKYDVKWYVTIPNKDLWNVYSLHGERKQENEDSSIGTGFNTDWNGKEYETYNLNCKTLHINLNAPGITARELVDNEKGFLFETPLVIDSNTYSSESIKVFNSQGFLLPRDEYELEVLFRNKETGKYNYLFRTKTKEEFSLVLHNNEWTQLNQFNLTNILQRYDRYEHWLDHYKNDYNKLPDFVKNFKNLSINKKILDISNDEERFEKVLSEYIKHHPEWYNDYLDTIEPNRFTIRYSDLKESDLKKFNNFSEVESKFQRVDFGISEYMMLTIRNEERNNNIAIYMNGLKYLGIRHIVHARNFSYIYILKQALPDTLDENSYFEVILKDEAYKFYSHTSLFDGDCMMIMGKDIEFIADIEEKLDKLKFFHNGRRLRKEDIYYNTDSDGNHSFFFNIKTYAGDYLAIEMSNHVCKEIKYIENLPEDGVLNIIKDANFKYPLSSKYYEIYINGRRVSQYNEHFITNFMLQFKSIKGNHSICIYEIGGLDKEVELNKVFNSAKDEWDTYIKSLSNIDKYKVENTIIDEDAYNKYIYTLAQYRMHLFYWWFLVPRVRKLDCNPFSVSTAPEVIQEIERLFPDFIDGVGTAVLDTHHQQTSVMYLGHGLEGYIANMLYVLDNIIPAFRPTDSNDYYVMRNLPYFKTENDTVHVNANVNGTPGLRVVPRLHMTQEEYEMAETPNYDDLLDDNGVVVIDSNYGL